MLNLGEDMIIMQFDDRIILMIWYHIHAIFNNTFADVKIADLLMRKVCWSVLNLITAVTTCELKYVLLCYMLSRNDLNGSKICRRLMTFDVNFEGLQ